MEKISAYCVFFAMLFGVHVNLHAETNIDLRQKEPLPLEEIRIFSDAFTKIKNSYVENVSDQQLLMYAIRGMIEGLDPHSSYLENEEYANLQEGTTGEFGGLGIEVSMENGFILVIAPIDGTPAESAGIKSGDLIVRIDGTAVKKMSLNEAIKRMRGEPGSEITLTIMRDHEDAPIEMTLTREIIVVKSVKYQTLTPGYAYVRISIFQTHTGEDLRRNLAQLKQEMSGGLQGLILDLRDNPGGILNAAIAVADLFLDQGIIVYTEGRDKQDRVDFFAKPADILGNTPLIVLINGGSASASEIVAGAIQDHKRGIIMGEQSFGKGSVQTVLPISQDVALKLTTARYYTPSGRSIQSAGITPDIMVQKLAITMKDANKLQLKEANLSGHLKQTEKSTEKINAEETESAAIQLLAKTDYQLYMALNVLKGLSFKIKGRG